MVMPIMAPDSEISHPSVMNIFCICLLVAPMYRNVLMLFFFSMIRRERAPITLNVAMISINESSRNDTHFSIFTRRKASSCC